MKRRGFTLIEVLITATILIALSTILVYVGMAAKRHADTTASKVVQETTRPADDNLIY